MFRSSRKGVAYLGSLGCRICNADCKAFCVTGREEGVYEWVAANYARSVVKVDPTDTIGVLHLGDESAEVLP